MDIKSNLPKFYIGQKVRYITGIHMPKNSTHIVSDYHIQPCGCHTMAIDGEKLKTVTSTRPLIGCEECGKVMLSGGAVVDNLWSPDSFLAVQEQNYPLMSFFQILKVEKEEILINN